MSKTAALAIIFGTRPELIKLSPIIQAASKAGISMKIIHTGQHMELIDDVIDTFKIKIDITLTAMNKKQSLDQLTSTIINQISPMLIDHDINMVMVQGDTTSAFAAALAAFYNAIPVVHIEAGLRSHNNQAPFPEEMNRKMISQIAQYHFAPTQTAVSNLNHEGITKNVHLVGNTVIDALFTCTRQQNSAQVLNRSTIPVVNSAHKMMLVTCHRRENFGTPFESICKALMQLAHELNDIEIVFPVHPNPNIKDVANTLLSHDRIHLIEPVSYPELVALMDQSHLILTDSGGIQEEAPSLGTPVLVMRDNTERPEGISAGTAKLVGTSMDAIIFNVKTLCLDNDAYNAMAKAVNPYGEGTSSKEILSALFKPSN